MYSWLEAPTIMQRSCRFSHIFLLKKKVVTLVQYNLYWTESFLPAVCFYLLFFTSGEMQGRCSCGLLPRELAFSRVEDSSSSSLLPAPFCDVMNTINNNSTTNNSRLSVSTTFLPIWSNTIITIIFAINFQHLTDRKVIRNELDDNSDNELWDDKLFDESKELAKGSGDKYHLSAENTDCSTDEDELLRKLKFHHFLSANECFETVKITSVLFSQPAAKRPKCCFYRAHMTKNTPFFTVFFYCVMYCIFSQLIYANQLVRVQPEISLYRNS